MPAPTPSPMAVHTISTRAIRPPSLPRRRCHLTPWDLSMFSAHYIQKGLLFGNLPSSLCPTQIIQHLEASLSTALAHFYPLAGRFVTDEHRGPDGAVTSVTVSIDCGGDYGAEFVHAVADGIAVADVVATGADVPAFVKSFFPLSGAVCYDGRHSPLVAVQVTELTDGVFVGCVFNHAVGDGTSYWHFFNAWAEIARAQLAAPGAKHSLSRPPVHDRWFIDGYELPPIKLPFSSPDQFIERYSPPPLREKMFHFSSGSIAKLKAQVNRECKDGAVISSFQALSSLVWRAVTRAHRLPPEQETSCKLAIQNRERLRPSLSPDYFGNSIYSISTEATAGELLARGLGWGARLVHRAVAAHNDSAIRGRLHGWMAEPMVYKLSRLAGTGCCVVMGSSPRFDMYGCDFGWGRAVAARSGAANKFHGKVSSYPGREGGGSVDLEVCLAPESMEALESDEEFMAAVSPPAGLAMLLTGSV